MKKAEDFIIEAKQDIARKSEMIKRIEALLSNEENEERTPMLYISYMEELNSLEKSPEIKRYKELQGLLKEITERI